MWGHVGKTEALSWCRRRRFRWACHRLYARISLVFWASKRGFLPHKLPNYRNEFCLLVNCSGKELHLLSGTSPGPAELMDTELMTGWLGLLDAAGCRCVGVYPGERNRSKKGGVHRDGHQQTCSRICNSMACKSLHRHREQTPGHDVAHNLLSQ